MTMLSSPLSTRNHLPQLIKEMGVTGPGVEVGTHRGDYASILLRQPDAWDGVLYCVDPWRDMPGYEHQAEILRTDLEGGFTREEDYLVTKNRLQSLTERAILWRRTSETASKMFGNGELAFAYIDGNHEPPHPYEDMVRWWPRVKPGGLLAGHDFLCPGASDGSWGRYIQHAVLKFAHEEIVDVHLIVEEGGLPWTWYVVKPG